MSYLVGVEFVQAPYSYPQSELVDQLAGHFGREFEKEGKAEGEKLARKLFENMMIDQRHLSMPKDEYLTPKTFDDKNDRYQKMSLKLLAEGCASLFERLQITPEVIDSLWSNTVTGFAIPSLEARLMNKLNFRAETKRMPMLGLGCMAGVAGMNRACEYLNAFPDEALLFMSVELCSLTVQLENLELANILATGLFGDGAALVLMVGDNHPLRAQAKLKFKNSHSHFFRESEEMMGWHVGEKGLSVILDKSVPKLIDTEFKEALDNAKEKFNSSLTETDWVIHPGGPKVLYALENATGAPAKDIQRSFNNLARNGNMSSVSVLSILSDYLAEEAHQQQLVTTAMGPGFSAEFGLWEVLS